MTFLLVAAPEKISKMTVWFEKKTMQILDDKLFPWDKNILKFGFQSGTQAASLIKGLSEMETRIISYLK